MIIVMPPFFCSSFRRAFLVRICVKRWEIQKKVWGSSQVRSTLGTAGTLGTTAPLKQTFAAVTWAAERKMYLGMHVTLCKTITAVLIPITEPFLIPPSTPVPFPLPTVLQSLTQRSATGGRTFTIVPSPLPLFSPAAVLLSRLVTEFRALRWSLAEVRGQKSLWELLFLSAPSCPYTKSQSRESLSLIWVLSGGLSHPNSHHRVQCLNLLRHPPPLQPEVIHLDLSIGNRIALHLTPPSPLAHHRPPLPLLQRLTTRATCRTSFITPMLLQERWWVASRNLLRLREVNAGRRCCKRSATGQNLHQHYDEMWLHYTSLFLCR